MFYLIGDSETTGLGPTYKNPNAPPKKACEFALMEIDPDTLENLGEIGSILNPECEIEAGAAEIHGITQEEAEKYPTLEEYLKQNDLPFEGEITLIGYRIAFDLPLLRPFGNIVRTLDLLPLVQRMFPELENHKLQTIKVHLGLPGGEAHRAIGDVYTTHQLLQVLIPASGRSLEAHCSTEFQIYLNMPWGKHAGKPLVSLPPSYKEWLLGLSDLDPNLRKSVELFSKTDKTIPYVKSTRFTRK